MNNSSTTALWLMAIPLVVGGVGGAAGIVAFFRWSLGQATIKTLKENNYALKEQVGILKAQVDAGEALIDHLTTQLADLRELVLQTKSIDKLAADMAARDLVETQDRHTLHQEQMEQMRLGFSSIVEAVRERPLPEHRRSRTAPEAA
jgi:hypothetical protein